MLQEMVHVNGAGSRGIGLREVLGRCQGNTLGGNIFVKAETVLFHAIPSRLADDARAEEYIVLQRGAGCNRADFSSDCPAFFFHYDQNIDVRPWAAIAARF